MDTTTDTNEFCAGYRACLAHLVSDRSLTAEQAMERACWERGERAWSVGAQAAQAAILGWDEAYRVGRDFGVTRELAAKLWEESIEAARAWLGAPAAVA